MSNKKNYDQDIRLNKNGKPKRIDLIRRWFMIKQDQLRSNTHLIRSLLIIVCLAGLMLTVLGGWHHSNVTKSDRAKRISELDQDLRFSKSGTEFKLLPQSRHGNMSIFPFKIDGADTANFDAKNYKVFVRQAGDEELPKRISGSIVMFGSNGYGAVVLRGDLKQQPMQIIVRNDKDYTGSDSDGGDGTIMLDGKETKIPYNAVAFTANPKGNNLKDKSKINKDMSFPELYAAAVGDSQRQSLLLDRKQAEKDLKNLEGRRSEMERRIAQLNKALGRDSNDMKYNTKVDDNQNENTNNVFREGKFNEQEYENQVGSNPENSDLSNTDMDVVRNQLISQKESLDEDIDTQESNIKGVQSDLDDLDETIDSMDKLTTVSNKFGISK